MIIQLYIHIHRILNFLNMEDTPYVYAPTPIEEHFKEIHSQFPE